MRHAMRLVAAAVFVLALAPATVLASDTTDITTVAGGGTTTPSTSFAPSTSVKLNKPTWVAAGPGNSFYVTDASCLPLLASIASDQDIGSLGVVAGQSGCGGTSTAPGALGLPGALQATFSFGHPAAFADWGGRFIVSDSDWGRVEAFDPNGGRINTVAGSSLASNCGSATPPAAPDGVAATSASFCKLGPLTVGSGNGNFLVVEPHRQTDNPPGTGKGDVYEIQGSYPTTAFTVHHVTGSYRTAQAIYGQYGSGVLIVDGHSAVISVCGCGSPDYVGVGNYSSYSNTGTTGFSGDGGQATDALLNDPQSIARTYDMKLLIADTDNCRIRVDSQVPPTPGYMSTIAGTGCQDTPPADIGDNGPSTAAYLGHPSSVAMTPGGILIADTDDNRIRLINRTTITSGPTGLIGTRSPQFTVASLDDPPRLQCIVDGGAAFACPSPITLALDTDGPHTLQVWENGHGVEPDYPWSSPPDPTPAVAQFTVDTTPPDAFTLRDPADGAAGLPTSPTFSWNATQDTYAGVDHYELWIDGSKDHDVPVSQCANGVCSAQPHTALSEGTHHWQVKAVDALGNTQPSDQRTVDVGGPPTAAFTISPNPALAGHTVTFNASASSDESGISRYEWDLDGDSQFELDSGNSAVVTRSYAAPATIKISLRVTDGVGKTSTTSQTLKVSDVQGTQNLLGISINSGAQFTNDPHVKLLVKAPPTATSILVSNDGGFLAPATFPVASSVDWTLDSSGPERLPKTVYARFMLGPIISETYTDDIILDQIPPVVHSATFDLNSAKNASVATALRTYRIRVRASDSNSGVGKLQFATDQKRPGKLIPYKKVVTVVSATKPRFVRARDRAGNFSPWKKLR